MVLQFYDIFDIQVTLPSAGDHRRWGRHRKTPCDQQLKKCDLISFQLNSPQFGVCAVLFPIHRSRWFGWFSASKFCKNAGADDVCRRSVGGGNIPESGAALQAPFQSWKTQGNNPRIGNFIHNQIIVMSMCVHLILIDSEPPQWTSWSCRQWSCSGQNLGKQRSNGWVEARAVYTKLQWHIEACNFCTYSLLVCWPFPAFPSFFVAGFHDANRLKRHWRCINLWDWNTLMNLDALCISLYPIILLPGSIAQSRSSQELLGLVNDPRQLGMWNQSTPGCDPRRGAEWWTLSWFMANTDERVYMYR